jgi:hypothetical protein
VIVRVGSRWLFGRDVVCSGQWAAVDDFDELMLGPSIFVVIEASPEGSKSTFNLACVSWCCRVSAEQAIPVIAAP